MYDPTFVWLGAMGPLLGELALMAQGNNLPMDVKEKVKLLGECIKKINESIMDLSELEDPPLMANVWMQELQELSHDMEDKFAQVEHSYNTDVGERTIHMANEMLKFGTRVQDACQGKNRYGLDPWLKKCPRRFVSNKHRLSTRHADPTDLAGPAGPMDELVNLIATNSDEQLKVASIVGPGGVGKTTLARWLYQKLRWRFECQAFVRVTSYPDMRRLLTSMFIQILRKQPRKNWDANDLIDNIAKYLEDKRYFIIIDDIWTASLWDIISRSFPNGVYCSRVIATTQIEDVALVCCGFDSDYRFQMRPLNEKHSRELFFSSVFGCEDACPKEFKEVSYEIIRQCGGLPLAIVNIASLFQREPVTLMEHWMRIQRFLCSSSCMNPSYLTGQQEEVLFKTNNDTSERVKKVLYLVYNNLPPHLKACLLYLNMYPADYKIKKDDLVKQWLAEGFLSSIEGQDREEVAEGYFDELISRGMIQPVETNYNGQALSCTVHHMVLDLIGYKSMEDNFITIVDYFQTSLGFPEKIRRLSVQFGGARGASMPAGIRMSQVRSLSFFGFIKCVPSIVKYRFLRVLILHIWADHDQTSFDLARICELFLLRYLKIECNVTVKFPLEMQGLQFLEALEVDARVDAVPSDIVHLQRLLHLHLPSGTTLPDGIGHMISLRTLWYLDLSSNLENNVLNLGKLTNLQELRLTCSTNTASSSRLLRNMGFVGSILRNLCNLKFLTLVPVSSHGNTPEATTSSMSISCDGLNNVNSPPALLQRLALFPRICIFSRLPKWIRHLDNLYVLKIAVRELSSSDIHLILKELPSLTALSLHVQTTPSTSIVIGQEGFTVLRFFTLKCALVCFTFHKGAMPNLESIKLRFCVNKEGVSSCENAGLQHLSSLKEISAKVWPAGAGDFDRGVTESYFKSTIEKIVKKPIVNVRCVQSIASAMFSESSAPLATEEFKTAMETENATVTATPAIVTENAMVSSSTGAMNSVIMKLDTLMGERYSKLTGTQCEAMTLKYELEAANTILEQLVDMGELKDDRSEMREMTYDIEDCIDDLMFYFDKGDNPVVWATLQKFIDQIRNLTGKMKKAALGSTARKTEMSSLRSTYVTSESRLSRVPDRAMGLVGVDGPRDQLVKRLIGDEQDLQMVCIMGSVGVGKTTLANEVYKMIRGWFEHQAFITPSKMVSQLEGSRGTYAKKENLRDKRYLIVIDGVWSSETWDSIKRALPDNNYGSRIIITTCDSDVVKSCGKHSSSFIYHMEPLSFDDSLRLFQSIIFGSRGSRPIHLEKVAEKIVKACRGLPLAISLTAGVFASRPAEMTEWDMVEKGMELSGADRLSAEEWMTKILHFSYSDLSRDMKTCLLYLSAFPEGHVSRKDRLIRRWIAEGFLPIIKEESWWETGERFFLELIARKLIEPVYWEDLLEAVFEEGGYDEMPLGYKTSGLVHGFIISLSCDENLVKLDNPKAISSRQDVIRRLSVNPDYHNNVIRRLSVNPDYHNNYGLDILSTVVDQSKVRSIIFPVGSVECIPDISNFKHLRVLDLGGVNEYFSTDELEGIRSSSLLRYLALPSTTELPKAIMELEHLVIIDLRGAIVADELSAIKTGKLVSLLAGEVRIRITPEQMLELEELSMVLVDDNHPVHCVAELVNKSKRLRMLGVKVVEFYSSRDINKEGMKQFFVEVANSSLQSLFLDIYYRVGWLDLLLDCWAHARPQDLRSFKLRLKFGASDLPKVPTTMATLVELTHLIIEVEKVEAEDLRTLGILPKLVSLELTSNGNAPVRRSICKGMFRCLKVFRCIFWGGGMCLKFEAEAMPQLRCLQLRFNAGTTKYLYDNFDYGIQHLSCLVQVRATIDCYNGRASDVNNAEAAIRDQVSQIPNYPTVKISRQNEYNMIEDEGQHSKK